MSSSSAKSRLKVVLIGAGHAHLEVLLNWARRGPPDAETIIIEPRDAMRYSGMMPGWIAGLYKLDEFAVDVAAVAKAAGAKLVPFRAAHIDADAQTVTLDNGEHLVFDILSVASGGVGRAATILGPDPRLLDVRPIGNFLSEWTKRAKNGPRKIAVVGGGAGGVELAFGLHNAADLASAPETVLFAGEGGLLPDHGNRARRLVREELQRQGIKVLNWDADIRRGGAIAYDGLEVGGFDVIVAAIGSGAPDWLTGSGMALDDDGFIAVDAKHRSISHPSILAAGDVARRMDRHVPHAGVHAVYAGPVLAHNLRAMIAGGGRLKSYRPRGRNLFLLSTAREAAILSYGRLAIEGTAMWRLKDWIDRRWINKFRF